jgi:DUF971 family protein
MAALQPPKPKHIELAPTEGLSIEWSDGMRHFYPVLLLRRLSPSADARELRKAMQRNPLTVLPTAPSTGALEASRVELVGNYALRIHFSDGHSTGIYSWEYLRSIAPKGDGASDS